MDISEAKSSPFVKKVSDVYKATSREKAVEIAKEKLPEVEDRVKMNIPKGENEFVILGQFKANAKQQGWPEERIKKVVDKASSGDYENLLKTIGDHCVPWS